MYTSGSTGQPAAVCGTEAGQLLHALYGLTSCAVAALSQSVLTQIHNKALGFCNTSGTKQMCAL